MAAKTERELIAEEICYRISMPPKCAAMLIELRESERPIHSTEIMPGTRCYLLDNDFAFMNPETKIIELTEKGTIFYYQLKIVEEIKEKEKENKK